MKVLTWLVLVILRRFPHGVAPRDRDDDIQPYDPRTEGLR